MDRDTPLGQSDDVDGRRALHVKIKNNANEPTTTQILDRHALGSIIAGDTTSVIGPVLCNGYGSLRAVLEGTWSGSVVCEITPKANPTVNSDWISIRSFNDNGNIGQNPIITNGFFSFAIGAAYWVRFRRSNAGTGTVAIEYNLSVAGTSVTKVVNANFNDFVVAAAQNGIWSIVRLETATVATITTVSVGTTSLQILAAQAARRKVFLNNLSNKDIYVAYAATASLTSYTFALAPGAHREITQPIYTGIWTAIATGAASSLLITETT